MCLLAASKKILFQGTAKFLAVGQYHTTIISENVKKAVSKIRFRLKMAFLPFSD